MKNEKIISDKKQIDDLIVSNFQNLIVVKHPLTGKLVVSCVYRDRDGYFYVNFKKIKCYVVNAIETIIDGIETYYFIIGW